MDNSRKHPVLSSNYGSHAAGCHGSIPGQEKKGALSHDGIIDCVSQMKNYLVAMNALCGAGTHIAQTLRDVLTDTALAEIAGQFLVAACELESATRNETSQICSAVEDWTQIQGDSKRKAHLDTSVVLEHDVQTLLKCFVALMKLQCQFFTSSTEVLAPFSKYQSLEDLLADADSCNTVSETSKQSAAGFSGVHAQLPKIQEKNVESIEPHRHVSHFFSKSVPKSDTSRSTTNGAISSQSASPNQGATLSQGATRSQSVEDAKENQSQCDHLWRQGLQAVDREKPPLPPGARPISGQGHMKVNSNNRIPFSPLPVQQNVPSLASEEEIDSIINFLSISTKPTMQTIPENPVPPSPPAHTSPARPVVPPGVQMMQEPYDYHNNNSIYYIEQQTSATQQPLRSSEGAMFDDALGVREFNKTNTWPSKLPSRNAGYQNIMSHDLMSSQKFPALDNLTNEVEAEYNRYISSVTQMVQGSSYHGNQGRSVWNSGEELVSTGWPLPVSSSESQDPIKNWSANQDSSSCSDDSSNGDNPFSVGLDLVATMNEQSRRHSTSDDTSSVSSSTLTEVKHRSLDDSSLEPKSTNTWPPKSPWARGERSANLSGPRSGDPGQYGQNAGLAVAWTDPLSSRQISPWAPGMTSHFLSGMQSYGPLPVGGAPDLSAMDGKFKGFHQPE